MTKVVCHSHHDETKRRRPLCNRVHASGTLVQSQARGTLMGNRGGRMHDPALQTLKRGQPWVNRQWISCVLSFKGRQRTVWGDDYTELFFLDEVTALAAGHRPCFECRRNDAKAFQHALYRALGKTQEWQKPPHAPVMDVLLHQARTAKKQTRIALGDLPVGSLFLDQADVFAIAPTGFKQWMIDGYQPSPDKDPTQFVTCLTPWPIVAALRAGYTPHWHPTMQEGDRQHA